MEARFFTSRSCISERESLAQKSLEMMRSSLLAIQVEKSSMVMRWRRSNYASRYGLALRMMQSTLMTLS